MSAQDPSYLSTYGITNPWSAWLVGADSSVLSYTVNELVHQPIDIPFCPDPLGEHAQPIRMLYRPGAWKCYQHDSPVMIPIETQIERAPEIDVLSRTDKMLDYRWNPGLFGEPGFWEIVECAL